MEGQTIQLPQWKKKRQTIVPKHTHRKQTIEQYLLTPQ